MIYEMRHGGDFESETHTREELVFNMYKLERTLDIDIVTLEHYFRDNTKVECVYTNEHP